MEFYNHGVMLLNMLMIFMAYDLNIYHMRGAGTPYDRGSWNFCIYGFVYESLHDNYHLFDGLTTIFDGLTKRGDIWIWMMWKLWTFEYEWLSCTWMLIWLDMDGL